jgi:hypothetical protein
MRSEVFAARLGLPAETTEAEEAQLSPEEVKEWLHIFGQD